MRDGPTKEKNHLRVLHSKATYEPDRLMVKLERYQLLYALCIREMLYLLSQMSKLSNLSNIICYVKLPVSIAVTVSSIYQDNPKVAIKRKVIEFMVIIQYSQYN